MTAIKLSATLINSLDAILAYPNTPYKSSIKQVRNALERVHIPNNDYDKVLRFIFLLLREQPSIMQNPNHQLLKGLCLYCIKHLETNLEPKLKINRRKP